MEPIIAKARFTPEDMFKLPEPHAYELVDGELVVRHTSFQTAEIAAEVLCLIGNYLHAHPRIGLLATSKASFHCFPDAPLTVRRPYGTMIRPGRLSEKEWREGHVTIAPDWAFEVVARGQSIRDLDIKMQEYVRAGIRLTWVVFPETRTVHVHRSNGEREEYGEEDELSGEDVIPGFRCKVSEIFPPADA